ncbi:helix-turn-helix transcriptional regulator [Polaribacter sp.]|uniref:helix-turn-helix transcriptional regulator n=1 Tax=Polaribacter sp. TaxID=1920175 RepID=UPI003EF5EF7B
MDDFPNLATKYLDSIPYPIEKNIKGHLSDYYNLKALVNSHLNLQAEVYHNYILTVKYAELEKNYNIAGDACIELFYNLFIVKKDTIAFDYLKKAEKYYTEVNDTYGLLDVMQMKDFAEYYNKNYVKSNTLILPKLAYYKSFTEDSYYYMHALFTLSSNYIHLKDDVNRIKYFNKFKSLESDTTIPSLLYKKYLVTLDICLGTLFLENNQLDSTLYYLKKVDTTRAFMNDADVENHFKSYISYYNKLHNFKAEKEYIDSLKIFNETLVKKNINASYTINESLFKSEQNLEVETNKTHSNRNWVLFLITLLIGIFGYIIVRYKKMSGKEKEFSKQKNEITFLHKNHEKLKVKVKGLENYITDLKKEIKNISLISDMNNQKLGIVELHKNIQHNSSVLVVKGEDYLDLINELNVDFFNQISRKHPELNSSETIICYYLLMEFKNKEISAFVNSSIRSVESKRYRIAAKLDLKNKKNSLLEYLQDNFKHTL